MKYLENDKLGFHEINIYRITHETKTLVKTSENPVFSVQINRMEKNQLTSHFSTRNWGEILQTLAWEFETMVNETYRHYY